MSEYQIEEVDVTVYREEILKVLRKNFDGYDEERFRWNYENSYYGKAHCWLARDLSSDTYIGTAAVFPRTMYVESEKVKAGITGDFAVDRAHRGFGPALQMQRIISNSLNDMDIIMFYGVPNQLSDQLFKKIGYNVVGLYHGYIKVLKTEYKDDHYLPPRVLTRPTSRIIDGLIRCTSREFRYRRRGDYKVVNTNVIDDAHDELFQAVIGKYPVIGEKTSSFLKWRFLDSPLHSYNFFYLHDSSNALLGYIIYYVDINRCHVEDILCMDMKETLTILLSEFLKAMRKLGIGSVSIFYLGNKELIKKLKKFNFILNKKETMQLMIETGLEYSGSIFSNPENWHFMNVDTDT